MTKAQNFEHVYTKCRRIARLARDNPQLAFTSLNHDLDLEWLRCALYQTRKQGAPGVDGQTWHAYEANLEDHLQLLLARAKSGTYRATSTSGPHPQGRLPHGDSPDWNSDSGG